MVYERRFSDGPRRIELLEIVTQPWSAGANNDRCMPKRSGISLAANGSRAVKVPTKSGGWHVNDQRGGRLATKHGYAVDGDKSMNERASSVGSSPNDRNRLVQSKGQVI